MRLLVDATHLTAEPKGVGLYTGNVLARLGELDPALDLHVLQIAGAGTGGFELPAARRIEVRWINHFWHGFRTLPRLARRLAADVVLVPYEVPLGALPAPCAMVCHDLPAEIRAAQERAGGGRRPALRRLHDAVDDRLLGRTLRRAAVVFANSRLVAGGLGAHFGVAADRIRLAPCAPAHDFAALSGSVRAAEHRERLGVPAGYVLAFFTGDERENLAGVVAAFDRLAAGGRPQGFVVAGVRPGDRERVGAALAARPWSERARILPFLGPAERDELVALYTAASAYLDLSLHEGFGMQVIEAMACGTPVVCSDRGALPEVTAGAALLVDPHRPEEAAGALAGLLTDSEQRNVVIALGRAQAARFSWRHTAGVIHQALQEVHRRHRGASA